MSQFTSFDIMMDDNVFKINVNNLHVEKPLVSCQACNVVNNVIYSLHNQHRRVEYEEIYRDTYRR